MKVWILGVVATWLCWTGIIAESHTICSGLDNYTANDHLQASSLSFTIDFNARPPGAYPKFLEDLRNLVKCPSHERHGIRALCSESEVAKDKYLFVDLSYSTTTITLALKKVDLYVVGYKVGNKAYLFHEYASIKDSVFGHGLEITVFSFSGSYSVLPPRQDVDLGFPALRNAINVLKESNGPKVKASLVTVIEMVPEAARYTIIERYVNRYDQNIRPLASHMSYENQWGDLSKAIQSSNDGKFPAVTLKGFCSDGNNLQFCSDGINRVVTSVQDVKADIGILKYFKPGLNRQYAAATAESGDDEEMFSVVGMAYL